MEGTEHLPLEEEDPEPTPIKFEKAPGDNRRAREAWLERCQRRAYAKESKEASENLVRLQAEEEAVRTNENVTEDDSEEEDEDEENVSRDLMEGEVEDLPGKLTVDEVEVVTEMPTEVEEVGRAVVTEPVSGLTQEGLEDFATIVRIERSKGDVPVGQHSRHQLGGAGGADSNVVWARDPHAD